MAVNLARYNSVAPTITDKDFSEIQCDANGRILVSSGGSGVATTVELAAQAANTTILRASGAGSIPTGVVSWSIGNAGGATGTVGGANLNPGETLSGSATGNVTTINTIAYDATGTDFLINYQTLA